MIITKELLLRVFPKANPSVVNCIYDNEDLFDKYGVDTRLRQINFFSQCGEETGGLISMVENGAPDNPRFRRYDVNQSIGNKYPGDGYNYRGRGLLQLTGRGNYRWIGHEAGFDYEGNPEMVAEPYHSILSALVYWHLHRLNTYADHDDIHKITLLINGGLNGYSDRIYYHDRLVSFWPPEN